jgi:hypothetical protein
MNRLFNTLISTFRLSPVASAVRQPQVIAAIEPLEGRQFFSAAPVAHPGDAPPAGPAVHASAEADDAKATPVAMWRVTAHADGVKGDRTFMLMILSDENGVVTAQIAGRGFGMKNTVMFGWHDSAGYHFVFNSPKASLSLDGAVGSDGKMTGSFSLMNKSGMTMGTFVATPVGAPA